MEKLKEEKLINRDSLELMATNRPIYKRVKGRAERLEDNPLSLLNPLLKKEEATMGYWGEVAAGLRFDNSKGSTTSEV